MGRAKNWTPQEEEYLIENWGSKSVAALAKVLKRTPDAIIVKKADWE